MIGSEALPFAKTGGLADVLGALPPALARLGWDVTLVAAALPRRRRPATLVERFPVTRRRLHARRRASSRRRCADGARALLVDCPSSTIATALYGVGSVDYPDNARRFACSCARRSSSRRGAARAPSIVHAHDWQAGLAPVYLKTLYASHPVLGGTPTVFTIHNLAYQGLFDADWLPRLDLPWELLAIDRLEFWGRISFLKGGINDADVDHDRQPEYARGDSDAGVRLRLRRHPAAPRAPISSAS